MGQHFAANSGDTSTRHIVTFMVGALAIFSVLAFVFSGTAFADEQSDDLTKETQTSITDEQGSEDSQSEDEARVPSATEPSAQVEEETASPSFPEPEMTAPADGEPGSQADSGLQWFATPVAGERRLEMDSARFSYRGSRGGVESQVRGPQKFINHKVKRIRIAFTRTDDRDPRTLQVESARFIKNGSTCRGRNVTTQSFGNKVVEFDVSRCNINIWEGSNDKLRVENISLSGGGQVPPDAFAMNVWVDDVFDHGDPREWTKKVENGELTIIIEPEDRFEISNVLMTRTVEREAKISGDFIARVQNQNGFDVDGSQQPAELRIISPNGKVIHTKQINANVGHAASVEPGNGWGGIDFKEKGEFTVPAGSRVEVHMILHGRNKYGRKLKEPSTRSPLGPGALEFQTEILEQRRQLCVQPDKTAPITGFRIAAMENIRGTISDVQALRFGTGNEAEEITASYGTNIDGLQLSGRFATAVMQPTGGPGVEGSPKPFCVDFSFNADRTVPENEVEKYFGLELDYALIPFEARAFDYDERDSENKTKLVGAKFAVYATKSVDDTAAGENVDQPDWDKRVWSSDQAETAKLSPGVYYLVEEQTPQPTASVHGPQNEPGTVDVAAGLQQSAERMLSVVQPQLLIRSAGALQRSTPQAANPTSQAQGDAQSYSLLPGPIRFELTYGEGSNDGFGINVPSSAEAPFVLSARVEDGRAIMDIGNITRGEMPLTGGHGVWGFVFAGLLLLAVGGYAAQRRRQV
ncbi:LPXTG cell wall anchor domain-containing protein [Corynebacterium pseudodiphtheriticum]|uniref:LPXTG cell wall anchor domain-containing protein n=1 Tax=Corynebacterium pseudodiphtheriticum TaxID=37637 RepID=UPI002549EF89|nr:LPXTG cell wall anchor domain-containing protein [Corynebacterium pseudodiphtheriticum]MDK8700203.1 LPXTG cell wall anchor domain-containing protein [Corynebacterium pseudodiphtheriticum]MDK8774467.1 LPXTG cell wall anchor domain-containing protein [Corynebacterium pseudodiphtheriticum]